MPRITPLRIVSLLVGGYLCLLAAWIALPSPPSFGPDDNYRYHESVLRQGGVLTTLHYRSTMISAYNALDMEAPVRDSYAIDWQLIPDCKTNSILLRTGPGNGVNLTRIALEDTPPGTRDLDVTLRAGDTDGANPPWFDEKDAVLLYWDIHHETYTMRVQVTALEPGVVHVGLEFDALATFSGIPLEGKRCDITKVHIVSMSQRVPTKTYWIRHYIIIVLAPLTLAIVAIAGPLATICYVIAYLSVVALFVYCVTVMICWAIAGFPPWRDWRKQHLFRPSFRSNRKKMIWGVTGPLLEETNKHKVEQIQPEPDRLVPLTSVKSFFQSSSPLDELLFTFEATKWMVEPVRRAPRHRPQHNDVESASSASRGAKITINANG